MISLFTSEGERIRLRWTQKKYNPFGLGCLYFQDDDRTFWPDEFKEWHVQRGAVIVCSNDMERKSIAGALGLVALGLSEKCVVVESPL
jgi:hypothetical protein